MIPALLQNLRGTGQAGMDLLFRPAQSPRARGITALFIVGLFAAGLVHWGSFLGWFGNHFDILDWHQQVGPYLDFISRALRSGQFPLHAQSSLMIPDRYLARPNRPFSPQILLLGVLDPATSVLTDLWIFYSLGFVGLLAIRSRYHLSLVSFSALVLLFNVNGLILDHLAVGHFEWLGYFLLPFFILLVLKMLEGEKLGWQWQFQVALIMLAMLLQGLVHLFIYCMAFLLLVSVFQPQYFRPVSRAILLSALASMIRILPAAIQYAGGTGLHDLGGFASIFQLLQSFVVLFDPRGDWEKAYYTGAIGFAFILYFGVIRNWIKAERYRPLYLPMLVMAFFSVGSIYHPLFVSHIPFMDADRASSRFLAVPFIFLIVLAVIQFQAWMDEWDPNGWEKNFFVLLGMGLMAYDLIVNSRIWQVENYSQSARATGVIQVAVGNYSDPPYIATLVIGFTSTTLTVLVLAFLSYREGRAGSLKSRSVAP